MIDNRRVHNVFEHWKEVTYHVMPHTEGTLLATGMVVLHIIMDTVITSPAREHRNKMCDTTVGHL